MIYLFIFFLMIKVIFLTLSYRPFTVINNDAYKHWPHTRLGFYQTLYIYIYIFLLTCTLYSLNVMKRVLISQVIDCYSWPCAGLSLKQVESNTFTKAGIYVKLILKLIAWHKAPSCGGVLSEY